MRASRILRTFSSGASRRFARERLARQVLGAVVMAQTEHPRVVVVDDDAVARQALAKLLQAEGYLVATADDAAAALAALPSVTPQLVVTDLKMPGMDGIELCRRVRDLDPNVALIVVTGAADVQPVIEGLRLGIDDYLLKPVDAGVFLWRVANTLERRALGLERAHLEREREEYAALVSHDLRNPLSSILAAAILLRREGGDPAGHADRIERNARRMNAMLEELTDAATVDSGEWQHHLVRLDLAELASEVVELMEASSAARVRVEVDDPPPCTVLGDRGRLQRCVANLLTNALKYSPDTNGVTLRLARHGNEVGLDVVDQGIGMSTDDREKVFDAYYRTEAGRAKAHGLGLGLYITRRIIEAHGGRVDVFTELGRGSTFRISLPALTDAPSGRARVTSGARSRATDSHH